jgi:riboflavin synthase
VFTGIIEEIGTVKKQIPLTGGCTLQITSNRILEDLAVEDSIAIDGVCLTVTRIESGKFETTAVQETLKHTTIGLLRTGDRVNLERALRFNSRIGGHLVQGHVDGVATVRSFHAEGTGRILKLIIPAGLANYVVNRGSIAINGVSLTVAEQQNNIIFISVIPFTFENTNLQFLNKGSRVNVEVDIMGKYVERFMKKSSPNSKIDEARLKSLGY